MIVRFCSRPVTTNPKASLHPINRMRAKRVQSGRHGLGRRSQAVDLADHQLVLPQSQVLYLSVLIAVSPHEAWCFQWLSRIQNIGYEMGENGRTPEWYPANYRTPWLAESTESGKFKLHPS